MRISSSGLSGPALGGVVVVAVVAVVAMAHSSQPTLPFPCVHQRQKSIRNGTVYTAVTSSHLWTDLFENVRVDQLCILSGEDTLI